MLPRVFALTGACVGVNVSLVFPIDDPFMVAALGMRLSLLFARGKFCTCGVLVLAAARFALLQFAFLPPLMFIPELPTSLLGGRYGEGAAGLVLGTSSPSSK